jgi:hypothetical protein
LIARWGKAFAFSAALASVACSFLVSTNGLSGGVDPPDARTPSGDAGPTDAAGPGSADGGGNGAGYRDAVLADRPMAYWRFEETDGTVAHDEVGQHPAMYAAATLGAAGIGGSHGVDLVASRKAHIATQSNDFQLAGNVPFAIELWAMPRSIADFPRLATTESEASSSSTGWFLGSAETVSRPYFTFRDANGAFLQELTASKDMPLQRFHHIVVTHDGTNASMWVDGERVAGSPFSKAGPALGILTIGARFYQSVYVNCFDGVLDEVAFYDHALDQAQIRAHYAAGTQ